MATRVSLTHISGLNIKIPPESGQERSLYALGPENAPGSATVYVWADALSELIRAARRRPTVMQAAILVGGLYAGPGERFVEVRGYMDLERHDDTIDFSRNLNDGWMALNNRVARRGEGVSIVGWACLRSPEEPLDSDILGRDIQMAHRSFFNHPYQLLVTIDPSSEHVVLYGLDEIGRLVQLGFQLVVDQ